MPPTPPATATCSPRDVSGRCGRGPSRARTASASTWLSAVVADGELVVDVPAKLSARVRVFSTGQGRKTDATDAHSIALVAARTTNLQRVGVDGENVALRLLVDRRDELGVLRTQTVNRIHKLLLELMPVGAKAFLTAAQAKALLTRVRPRDVAGKTRRALAAEKITDLAVIDAKIKAAKKQLTALIALTGSQLLELNGIGPQGRHGCWVTSATSPGSRRRATSRPGTGPHPSTPPAATTTATASCGRATGASTGCCTSPRSCRSVTTRQDGPTTGGSWRRGSRRCRRCGA
nr:transposase [Kineococcus siccus]